jgi:crotonobetainyl-CoA hydratase
VSDPAALYAVSEHIATVTLNRPAAANAVNAELATIVGESLEQADHDPDVRAVVLTAAGERHFCAGADLKEVAAGRAILPSNPAWGFAGVVHHALRKPLIAAVNGVALGGGTEIALACDLVVAAAHATFGLPEVKRGILAGAGGLVRLPMQVPLKIALELALTGEPIDAATAERWGLVNRVVPTGQELDAAVALAATIAGNAPLSVQASKRVVCRIAGGEQVDERDGWAIQADALAAVLASEDAREGPRAFVEKRAPNWTGR